MTRQQHEFLIHEMRGKNNTTIEKKDTEKKNQVLLCNVCNNVLTVSRDETNLKCKACGNQIWL